MKINQMISPALISAIALGLFSIITTPLQALETFGNEGIQFELDTIIEFEFVESNGAFQSTFGVINLDTGEKTPLISEAKPSNKPQDISRPSDFQDDTGVSNQNDFLGTPGDAVPQPLAEFKFQANTRYAFYLESFYNGKPVGIIYSTNTENPNTRQQTEFNGGIDSLAKGGNLIRWDDTGIVKAQQERDFDDFIVRVGGHQTCPSSSNVLASVKCLTQN